MIFRLSMMVRAAFWCCLFEERQNAAVSQDQKAIVLTAAPTRVIEGGDVTSEPRSPKYFPPHQRRQVVRIRSY